MYFFSARLRAGESNADPVQTLHMATYDRERTGYRNGQKQTADAPYQPPECQGQYESERAEIERAAKHDRADDIGEHEMQRAEGNGDDQKGRKLAELKERHQRRQQHGYG